MKKYLGMVFLILVILCGCGNKPQSLGEKEENIPNYSRKVNLVDIKEKYNPYMSCFCNGVIYYIAMEEDNDGDEKSAVEYNIYSQDVAHGMDSKKLISIRGGIIKTMQVFQQGDNQFLAIIWIDENDHIMIYDSDGRCIEEVLLEAGLVETKSEAYIAYSQSGSIYLLSDGILYSVNGGTVAEVLHGIKGFVKSTYVINNKVYIVCEKNEKNGISTYLDVIDAESGKKENEVEISQEKSIEVWSDNEKLLVCNHEKLFEIDLHTYKMSALMNMADCELTLSGIKDIYCESGIIYICMINSDNENTVLHYTFTTSEVQRKENDMYYSDGRRIVNIAVPEDYVWDIEFNAKKINQMSEDYYYAVHRYDSSLETYLGMGSRPDIIMAEDQTELDYCAKNDLLVDLSEVIAKNDSAITDLISNIARIQEYDGKLLSFATNFKLLLSISDEGGKLKIGNSSTRDYLNQYYDYIQEKQPESYGDVEMLLFGAITAFYDYNEKTAFFDSDEFESMIMAYKKIHEYNMRFSKRMQEQAYDEVDYIIAGPKWYWGVGNVYALANEDYKLAGVPMPDGAEAVYVSLFYPMGVLKTSDCVKASADFISYYCNSDQHFWRGYADDNIGESYTTTAMFYTNKKKLNSEIFETEKPYAIIRGNTYDWGDWTELHFTEANKENINDIIERAIPVSKEQNDIYSMMLEEIADYLNGGKSLKDCCEVLQKRVSIYLEERR